MVTLVKYPSEDILQVPGNVRHKFKGCGRDWLNAHQCHLLPLDTQEDYISQPSLHCVYCHMTNLVAKQEQKWGVQFLDLSLRLVHHSTSLSFPAICVAERRVCWDESAKQGKKLMFLSHILGQTPSVLDCDTRKQIHTYRFKLMTFGRLFLHSLQGWIKE